MTKHGTLTYDCGAWRCGNNDVSIQRSALGWFVMERHDRLAVRDFPRFLDALSYAMEFVVAREAELSAWLARRIALEAKAKARTDEWRRR